MRRPSLGPCWLAVWLSVSWVVRTEAYVDPGTGALLWQLLLATVVGFFFYARRLIRSVGKKVLDICFRRPKRDR